MTEIHKANVTKLIALCLTILLATVWLTPQQAKAAGFTPVAVTVTVEGKPLEMPVQPVVLDGNTLVGARYVAEAMGGDIQWNAVTNQVTILRRSDVIVLTIAKKEALVNNRLVTMPVAAQAIDGRTMVPLRFIVEALGGTVEWNQATRTANILRKPAEVGGVSYVPGTGKARVVFNLSEPPISVTPRVDGHTLTLDLYPALVVAAQPLLEVNDNLLKQVTLRSEGRTAHLEVQLWNAPRFRHSLSPDGTQLTLELDYSITGFRFYQNGRIPTLNIGTTGQVDFSTLLLPDPARAVIDIPGARLAEGVPATIDVGDSLVTRVRTGQKDPATARVVLDATAAHPFDVTAHPWGLQVQFVPRIQSLTTELLPGKTRLHMQTNLPIDAKVTALPAQKQIRIEIPQGRSDLAGNPVPVKGGAIESIAVAAGAEPNSTVITLQLPFYVGHTLLTHNGDKGILLDVSASPVAGKRIWIDAGHGRVPGGTDDPGTIGRFYNTYEKVVNLEVALELQQRLQAAGAVVYMTRTGDEGVDFVDRPALVNALKPPVDLFISIHHNSAGNPAARGIETYYWTTNPKSRRAAEKVHASLLRILGFPDRKVRQESFLVIKETIAPAILVELGYLTNSDEEKAIAEPGAARRTYPATAAEALKSGIFDYFWQEIGVTVAN